MFEIIEFGILFENVVKTAAGFLADDGYAGLICWILLLALILLSAWYLYLQHNVSKVLTDAVELVVAAKDRDEFANKIEIRQSLNSFADSSNKGFTRSFGSGS